MGSILRGPDSQSGRVRTEPYPPWLPTGAGGQAPGTRAGGGGAGE